MKCPNCGTNNPPEEQLTYCKKCGTELRTICPRCNADNPSDAEHCSDCGLELHPDRGHERTAGIRVDPNIDFIPAALKQRPTLSTGMLATAIGILVVVWIPVFVTLKKKAQVTRCQSNLKNIVMAMQAYSHDYGGHAPTAYEWPTLLMRYMPDRKTLECPSRPGHIGYAFNLGMGEAPLARLNNSGTLIAFFETADEKNLSGSESLWLTNAAHSRGNNLVFADGTVRQSLKAPPAQYWQPKMAAPKEPVPVPNQSTTEPANQTSDQTMSQPMGPSGNPPRPGEMPTVSPLGAPEGSSQSPSSSNPPPPGVAPTNPPPPS